MKLIGDVMGPAGVIIRETSKRQSAGQATREDLAAGFRAASDALKFFEQFDSAWNRRFPEVPSSTPDAVLRTYRRYQLRFWQTAPVFLRNR